MASWDHAPTNWPGLNFLMFGEMSTISSLGQRKIYYGLVHLRMPPAGLVEVHGCCYTRASDGAKDATGLPRGGSRSLLPAENSRAAKSAANVSLQRGKPVASREPNAIVVG